MNFPLYKYFSIYLFILFINYIVYNWNCYIKFTIYTIKCISKWNKIKTKVPAATDDETIKVRLEKMLFPSIRNEINYVSR